MDKLLNINRQGGYPLCAENVSILHENSQMLNAILSKINIPYNVAVLVFNNFNPSGSAINNTFYYVFVTNGFSGELLKVSSSYDIPNHIDEAHIDIVSTKQSVTLAAAQWNRYSHL